MLVRKHHPVRIPVKRNPDVRLVPHHGPRDNLGMQRAATLVDVAPVWRRMVYSHLTAQPGKQLWSHGTRRPVGTVQHHRSPIQ